jgi:hypothetical protein
LAKFKRRNAGENSGIELGANYSQKLLLVSKRSQPDCLETFMQSDFGLLWMVCGLPFVDFPIPLPVEQKMQTMWKWNHLHRQNHYHYDVNF